MKRTFLFLVFLLAASPVIAGEAYRVEADIGVTLDYVFINSTDNFVVKYAMKLEGEVGDDAALVRGVASVKPLVVGFYAKWDLSGCALNVRVDDIPFEIHFSKPGEKSVRLRIGHGDFSEAWMTSCTFYDKPGTRVVTDAGEEIQWLAKGLERVFLPLREIQLPIDPEQLKPTKFHFDMDPFTVGDDPVGEAVIEGQMTLKVIPINTPS